MSHYKTSLLSYAGIWLAATAGALLTDSPVIGATIAIVFIAREAIKEYNSIPDSKMPDINFDKITEELNSVKAQLAQASSTLNEVKSDVSNIQMANGIKKLK